MLTDNEKETIGLLRAEANSVKDCYTRYYFQALGLAAVSLGLILRFQEDNPLVGLASLLVIGLALSVVRIGLHKYETANRHFGYELHLYRRSRLRNGRGPMGELGWEEVFHAWRTIHPKIYKYLYWKFVWLIPTIKRRSYKSCKHWISPMQNSKRSYTSYAAGSYLAKTFLVLHLFAIGAFVPLAYMSWQLGTEKYKNLEFLATPSYWILGIAFGFVLLRIARVRTKRKILESELLSINTCAIMWRAVTIAHTKALKRVGAKLESDKEGNQVLQLDSYEGYTDALVCEAEDLLKNLKDIYRWMAG